MGAWCRWLGLCGFAAFSVQGQRGGTPLQAAPPSQWEVIRNATESQVSQIVHTRENPGVHGDEDPVKVAARHVPFLHQVGFNKFEYLSPHEMVFVRHYIQTVYVVDLKTNETVYLATVDPVRDVAITRVGFTFELLDGNVPAPGVIERELVPYTSCNLHGLWKGDPVFIVDARSWNRTTQALSKQEEIANSECTARSSGQIERISLGQNVGLSLRLSSDKSVLEGQYEIPHGNFFAAGFNDNMINTYGVICQLKEEAVPTLCTAEAVSCSLAYLPDRFGPVLTISQALQVTSVDCSKEASVVVNWEKKLESDLSGPLGLDLVVKRDGTAQPLVYAYGANRKEDQKPVYHGLNGRGYLSVNLVDSSTTILRADTRDLKVVHGVMMYLIWAVNITTGALLARYARKTTWWLGAHRVLQGTSTLITFPVFYLTYTWESVPWNSGPHHIMGHVIVLVSWLQASLGAAIYHSSKLNKEFIEIVRNSKSFPASHKAEMEAMLEKSEPRWILRMVYDPKSDFFSKDANTSLKACAENFFLHRRYFPLLPSGPHKWIAIHGVRRVLAPMHRIVGLILPIVALFQIYLGAKILKTNDVVIHMLVIWEALIVALVIYKETEKQLNLPPGISAKFRKAFGLPQRKPIPDYAIKEKPSATEEAFPQYPPRNEAPRPESLNVGQAEQVRMNSVQSPESRSQSFKFQQYNGAKSSVRGPRAFKSENAMVNT